MIELRPRRAHPRRPIVLLQFSDRLLTPADAARSYYERSYARMAGYRLPLDFMEIPYWIPLTAARLPDDRFAKELMVDTDGSAAQQLCERGDDVTVLMSVMDASLRQSLEVMATGVRCVVGTYVDPVEFSEFENVEVCHELEDLARSFPGAVTGPPAPDYRLFDGLQCIPRFSLSSGCSFRCAFCTVPSKLVAVSEGQRSINVEAITELDFNLVFIDDKSFGQAPNWRSLEQVGAQLSEAKPDFLGFIVQTPPSIACRPGFMETCRDLGVRYVEFGVEVVNDEILRWMRKPFTVQQLERACQRARQLGLYVIPNLIVGVPGDDYAATTAWLERNVDIVPVVNVNWLAVHWGNERGDLGLPSTTIADRDQNASTKSWLRPSEEDLGHRAIEEFYRITEAHWHDRSVELRPLAGMAT